MMMDSSLILQPCPFPSMCYYVGRPSPPSGKILVKLCRLGGYHDLVDAALAGFEIPLKFMTNGYVF